MTWYLHRVGHEVGRKRGRRLVAIMDRFTRKILSKDGRGVLYRGATGRPRALLFPGNFQYRPRVTIYDAPFYRDPRRTSDPHQHGRAWPLVLPRRLWRSLKYECVYLHAFETGSELRAGVGKWIAHYNERRPHTALAGRMLDVAYRDVLTPSGPGLTLDQMANSNAVRMAA